MGKYTEKDCLSAARSSDFTPAYTNIQNTKSEEPGIYQAPRSFHDHLSIRRNRKSYSSSFFGTYSFTRRKASACSISSPFFSFASFAV